MKKTALFAAVAASLLASTAFAAPGYYVYGGLGYSKADTDFASESYSEAGYQAAIDADEKSVGLKLAAGYRFNDYFAVEGSYAYLGKADVKVSSNFGVGAEASMKAHVLAVDAVGIYPVAEKVDLFAKAGVGMSYVKTKANADLWNEAYSFSESDTRFISKLGLGAEYKVTKNVAVRAEYERYFGVSKDSDYSIDADYDFVSVGVKYTF